jgi:integrase
MPVLVCLISKVPCPNAGDARAVDWRQLAPDLLVLAAAGASVSSRQSITTRQYARLVSEWIADIGPDPQLFGTHSRRRTKATIISRRTGNLRAVQLLLGHTKIESTARYLGIEVDDALAIRNKGDV